MTINHQNAHDFKVPKIATELNLWYNSLPEVGAQAERRSTFPIAVAHQQTHRMRSARRQKHDKYIPCQLPLHDKKRFSTDERFDLPDAKHHGHPGSANRAADALSPVFGQPAKGRKRD
jgi:hypothetical protein